MVQIQTKSVLYNKLVIILIPFITHNTCYNPSMIQCLEKHKLVLIYVLLQDYDICQSRNHLQNYLWPFWYLGWEDFPEEGNGNPFRYPCLENLMDRGAWWATVHGVAKSQTRLSDFIFLSFTFWYRISLFYLKYTPLTYERIMVLLE